MQDDDKKVIQIAVKKHALCSSLPRFFCIIQEPPPNQKVNLAQNNLDFDRWLVLESDHCLTIVK